MTKTCSRCGRTLPISEFSLKRDSRTGNTYRRSHCRECVSAYQREWRAKGGATQSKATCLYTTTELRFMPDDTLLDDSPNWLLQEAMGYGHSTVSLIKNKPWDNGKVEFSDVWNDITIKRVREYLDRLIERGIEQIRYQAPKEVKQERKRGRFAERPQNSSNASVRGEK